MKIKKVKMPPIGLKPKFVNRLERLNEVRGAIVRYYEASREIPIEWVEEYNELINATK
tara:strand:- start:296 stop:469 length:174 start_codon:yes stop_codon:yes gene_type:complete